MRPTPVWFLLLEDSLLLDWAGPAEALRIANQLRIAGGLPPAYELRFTGPSQDAATSVGVHVHGLAPLPPSLPPEALLVLVGMPGPRLALRKPGVRAAVDWLRTLQAAPPRLVTICAGALLAGHAGLLHGRRATTHHQHLDELRAIAPGCQVVDNRVFVLDGPVASSAGITTGIDLALHLVAQQCGAPLAARVAQTMVVALRRGPQDPELSPFLSHRNHMHAALHLVQDAVSSEPQRDWDVASMAHAGHTSTRHLTRLFVQHAGLPPLDYLRRIRLAVAQAALQSGRTVTQAAELAGFSSDTQLRRAWRVFEMPGTPSGAAREIA
ncbi:GlxA family transcriptional regulator [Ramlibacter humi]|uniref:Helix-turn-helix domain-containing protein n=1 Tax=Ramlibacter humi TaxID=2530451 RepID=A0A4Z0BYS5_9BURK|nr:helix-turn-helix domain-containing protein [Ramlibacter humi]TFZ04121.1 helix-turn-helix domain-containing protein [Ramlibacter humi]